MKAYFSKFGKVTECIVMSNPETGKSRGFGFLTFEDPASIKRVLQASNHQLDGRTVWIIFS